MDVQNIDGWTALMVASDQGHADVVYLLLEAGRYTADIETCTYIIRNISTLFLILHSCPFLITNAPK